MVAIALTLLLSSSGVPSEVRAERFQGTLLPADETRAQKIERLESRLDLLRAERPTYVLAGAMLGGTVALTVGGLALLGLTGAWGLVGFAVAVAALPGLGLLIGNIVLFYLTAGRRARHDTAVAALRSELDRLTAQGENGEQQASVERELSRMRLERPNYVLPGVVMVIGGAVSLAGLVMLAQDVYLAGLVLLPGLVVLTAGLLLLPLQAVRIEAHDQQMKAFEGRVSTVEERGALRMPMVELARF